MKKILFTMLLVGMIIPMSAQIKGTVTDTYNNPVKYAKVAIYSLPDSVQIAGTTANERGEFTFPNYYSVNKLIKISYNGYKTTKFRALPEQHVKLRDELTMPDNLTLNIPGNLPFEEKNNSLVCH
ncbi:MAG: carboxypeptidase regulatory-like domain-containing protein [Fermentimonas sp.]|nr:carboxypeptidase regulatory-like domain-containing protein [Fermentimonas sp.]MBF6598342.1 carboxypeptidase regulatory-like domain-containing protein [Fermentimonas sp.]